MSRTTSAAASISVKEVLFSGSEGVIVHDAETFKLERSDNWSGSKLELRLILGNE